MSEVLRELVVALSLDSDNFARNLRTINKRIKEAESTFNLAGAGIDKFEGSVKGTEAKLSMLGQKLKNQKLAVDQYARALVQANQKLVDSHTRQEKMTRALEEAKRKYAALPSSIDLARARYEAWNTAVGEGDARTQKAKAELDALEQEYKYLGDEIKKLEGQLVANAKTMQNNADAIATAKTNLNNTKAAVKTTESEIRKLTEQLYRQKSVWTQAGDALTKFSKHCDTVSKAMVTAGRDMTKALTTPILALGAAAVKSSIEYESAFASVRKTVDATEAEFASLV